VRFNPACLLSANKSTLHESSSPTERSGSRDEAELNVRGSIADPPAHRYSFAPAIYLMPDDDAAFGLISINMPPMMVMTPIVGVVAPHVNAEASSARGSGASDDGET
jgi:hypothetical protein